MNVKGMFAGGLVLFVSLPIIGCGGGNGSVMSAPSAMTQSQALDITSDLFAALASAPLAAGGTAQTRYLQSETAHIRGASLGEAGEASSVASLNIPRESLSASPRTAIPSYTYACPIGGNVVVTGSYTGTYSATAENVTENLVGTINSCSDDGITINGNPNVAMSATVTLAGNSFTDFTTITGGFTSGSNSCSINATISADVNEATGAVSGTLSGTVCGISIDGTL